MTQTTSARSGLTRRGFLKSTGATAGLAAIAGLAGCAPAKEGGAESDLAETGVVEEQVFRGVCRPNCFGFCHMNVHVRDGHVVKTSRRDYVSDPHYSRICQRGLSHVHRINDPERLKYPLRRVEGTERGAGEWERISWDEAISEVAAKIKEYQGQYGPQALATMSISGNYGQLTNAMYNRLFSFLDACSISADSDMASYYGGWRFNGGINECNEISDVLNSKTIMVYGANITDAQVHHWHFIKEAQQNGTKLIVVDPIYTQLASKADIWVPIRPGADTALFMGIMNIVVERGAVDVAFMTKSTVGPFLVRSDTGKYLRLSDIDPSSAKADEALAEEAGEEAPADPCMVLENGELVSCDDATAPDLDAEYNFDGVTCRTAYALLRDEVAKFPVSRVAEMTQLTEETIEELADYCIAGSVSHLLGYGNTAYGNGVQVCISGMTMAALTGNMCKPGSTFGNSYPVYTGTNYAFSSPQPKNTPGVGILSLPEVMKTGQRIGEDFPIKMLFIWSANPYNTMCHTNALINDVWPNLDYVVTVDTQMTDTACYSDLVLPCGQHFEQVDICTDGPTWNLHYNEKCAEPPYEAKRDSDIARLLAQELGYGEYFQMTDEEAIKEILETEDGVARGLTIDALKEQGDLRYDVADPHVSWPDGTGFATPTGRLEFYQEDPQVRSPREKVPSPERYEAERLPHWFPPFEAWSENDIMKKYPLQLMSERPRYRVHSQYYNVAMLREIDPEPIVKINPQDAKARGIEDGSYVDCYNDRGHAVAKAVYSEAMRPGVMVYPKGWQRSQHKAGGWSELLTNEFDEYGVNSNFMDVVCEVRPWNEGGDE
ncbi:molybdopterin-dependent oxidoreductase [Adlercreutzia sp. R21]|uniref:Molybdopterin-dependent oxidoreductase n=1 Tax=Adlercreutzia wanghongyangiae TaxID=3111451 RepID=A0ABU6IIJ1_9ACTN|nr:molybdopterin-dependent oxidoreductase [Adlercreutzia sp. R21]MEC4176281.1 molybdopterin-dependent oxidoreductase [Adlercreutzia sp. R7]MEC4184363.1 molybdopterin-dependent oxidoreductase [Adlercreutzia sp. R21]